MTVRGWLVEFMEEANQQIASDLEAATQAAKQNDGDELNSRMMEAIMKQAEVLAGHVLLTALQRPFEMDGKTKKSQTKKEDYG